MTTQTFVRRIVVLFPLLALACGGGGQTSGHDADASSLGVDTGTGTGGADGGAPPAGNDAGMDASSTKDAAGTPTCVLPAAPADVCAALPTGKVVPCSVDGGQPSQTGYLEIDMPGAAPVYVCATSWSSDPDIGYIFGQPATFMSQAQSCCGAAATGTAAPTVPDPSVGSLGAPHIPSHIKPQELVEPGSGLIRQNPFAVTVTDATSGAAANQAITTWLSWAGDGKAHPAPDGTGAYYFASDVSINYAVLETSQGFPVIVIGPEVSLTADQKTPVGHPSLGVCPAGGGAVLAQIAGEVKGMTLNNHSGRFDYGPWVTSQGLDNTAKLFNCMGISITATKYTAPKS